MTRFAAALGSAALLCTALLCTALLCTARPASADSSRARTDRDALVSVAPAVEQCVERSRQAGEATPARLTVGLLVATDGRAREVQVAAQSAPQLAQCVVRVVEGLRFSPRAQPSRLRLPLHLAR